MRLTNIPALLVIILIPLLIGDARGVTFRSGKSYNGVGGYDESGTTEFVLSRTMSSIKIVDSRGRGDYTTIQQAVDDAVPGDTIRVIGGVYQGKINISNSGTRERPITIEAYPGHKPIIVPGSESGKRVEFNAEWIVFQGFEIMKGWDGIKIYKPNNVIRQNYIHDNKYMGILVVSTDNTIIEGNKIENNGVCSSCCFDKASGRSSPKHCHGIYLSDYKCMGLDNTIIKDNYISGHGGRGIQWNGAKCDTTMNNTLVEGNTIENNSWGLAMYYNVEGSVIKNNKFINNKRPKTDDSDWTFLGIWKSKNNSIEGNSFSSSLDDFSPLFVMDSTSAQNEVNGNVWKINSQEWIWKGSSRDDFSRDYQKVTGWDKDGRIN